MLQQMKQPFCFCFLFFAMCLAAVNIPFFAHIYATSLITDDDQDCCRHFCLGMDGAPSALSWNSIVVLEAHAQMFRTIMHHGSFGRSGFEALNASSPHIFYFIWPFVTFPVHPAQKHIFFFTHLSFDPTQCCRCSNSLWVFLLFIGMKGFYFFFSFFIIFLRCRSLSLPWLELRRWCRHLFLFHSFKNLNKHHFCGFCVCP